MSNPKEFCNLNPLRRLFRFVETQYFTLQQLQNKSMSYSHEFSSQNLSGFQLSFYRNLNVVVLHFQNGHVITLIVRKFNSTAVCKFSFSQMSCAC